MGTSELEFAARLAALEHRVEQLERVATEAWLDTEGNSDFDGDGGHCGICFKWVPEYVLRQCVHGEWHCARCEWIDCAEACGVNSES